VYCELARNAWTTFSWENSAKSSIILEGAEKISYEHDPCEFVTRLILSKSQKRKKCTKITYQNNIKIKDILLKFDALLMSSFL
jgi:hypothetical protein